MAIAATRTDAELVRRLQARDRATWEELYAEFQPRLRAFGYRLTGNAFDADDLAHETFVRALPALDRIEPDSVDLDAYLLATAKNLFLKQVERTKRAEPTADVPEPDLPSAIEDDPERSALLAQQEEVRIATARLDPRLRLVLALCELEDRSYAEIGKLLGLSENAVAQLVFRARERLRAELRLVHVDPASLPEECRTYLPLLAQYLDGRLGEPRLDQTLAHLETCERCESALADMRDAKRRYRALLLPPPGMSTDEARAAVEEDFVRVGYWRPGTGRALLRRPRAVAAASAAVGGTLLVLAVGLGAATLLTDGGAVPTTAPRTDPPAVTDGTGSEPPPPATQEPQPAPPATNAPAITPPPRKDTKPPTVAITADPGTATTATDARFAFAADQASVSLACRVDGGTWQPCTSPLAIAELSLGAHTFDVRGTDPAGSTGRTATHRWTVVDPPTTGPTVTLTDGPPATTTSRSATFAFQASDAHVTFACSYDSAPFSPCASPYAIADVGVDDHTFAVRATDAAGDTGAVVMTHWTVVTMLPDLVVHLTDTSVTVQNLGQALAGPSLITVAGVGSFAIPSLASGQLVTRAYPCTRGTIVATADDARVVAESNEGNNMATRRVSCPGLSG